MKRTKKRQQGTGSIFRKWRLDKKSNKRIYSKYWTIQYFKDGRRIREATGTTDWVEASKLLRQRLVEIDRHEHVTREAKPARVEELCKALEADYRKKHHISEGKKTPISQRWAHLSPIFGSMLASHVTTDDI